MNKKPQFLSAFIVSAMFAVVFVAVATVYGELHSPFKAWLASTFSHHWVGKGILSMAIFFGVGLLGGFFVRRESDASAALLNVLAWATVFSFIAIFGFYYYEVFLVHH